MRDVFGRLPSSFDEERVESALRNIGIDIAYDVQSDYIIYCPYHQNTRTPAAEVAKETGMFYCFSCRKTASLEELIMHVTGMTYFQAMRLIGNPVSSVDDIDKKMVSVPEFEEFDVDLMTRLQDSLGYRGIEYMKRRGITDLDEFGIGYSVNRDSIIIPVHSPHGMLVGFQARGIGHRTFGNSPGLPRRRLLFNLHRVRSSPYVYMMESPMDVMRCHQLGIPAVASFGSSVTKEQIRLIKRFFPEVYVVPDRDDAGRSMALTMMSVGATLIPVPEGNKDVGDLSDDEIRTLLDRSDILAGVAQM